MKALCVALLLFAHAALAAPVAIINVNVVPMIEERVVAAQTVIVDGGKIIAIGSVDAMPLPEAATVIDGTDRYLIPGLAEMHAHIPVADSPGLDRYFSLFVANGVTTVRGMLGHSSHLQLREDLIANSVFGPRLITSGPSLNGNSVSSAADGEQQVRQQHAAGYDFIKIHPGLRAVEFDAIASTARELSMPVAGHVTTAVGIEQAMRAGMATVDHLDGYLPAMLPPTFDSSGGYGGWFGSWLAEQVDVGRIDALVAATVAAGTWNVPTNILVEQLINDTPVAELTAREDMQYMPPATVQGWADAKRQVLADNDYSAAVAARAVEIRRQLILALHEAGAGLLLGSDAPQIFNVPGFSVHYELENLVAAGLSPYEALATATRNVGEFLKLPVGTVEVGMQADLVLLDANPLTDISASRRIYGVVLRGKWYSVYELQDRIDRYSAEKAN